MVNESLVNYFKEGVSLENSVDFLSAKLIEAGWLERDVKIAEDFFNRTKGKKYSFGMKGVGKNKRPFGVKIVSILNWLIAVFFVLLFTLEGTIFSSFFGEFSIKFALILNLSLGLILATFPLIIGVGIWSGWNSWRIVGIIFNLLFMGFSFLFLPEGLILFLILFFISLYLLVNKRAKNYFHRRH